MSDLIQSEAPRLLTEEDGKRVMAQVAEACDTGGELTVSLISFWSGSLKWARNRAAMTSDSRDVLLSINQQIRGARGQALTNQIDPESVLAAARLANRRALLKADRRGNDRELYQPHWDTVETQVWSEATLNRSAIRNGEVVNSITEQSEREGLLSAGYLEARGANATFYSRDRHDRETTMFRQLTQAECSVTVRAPDATGSGWAGVSSFDFATINESELAQRAFEKCVSSRNAVRIEPGRYTTILEPQASATMLKAFVRTLNRNAPEQGRGPLTAGPDKAISRFLTRLGLRVVDERVTISHDPSDPENGIVAMPSFEKVVLIENGVLKTLYNSYEHAVNELGTMEVSPGREAFRMAGGDVSMDEMIETTDRGLIVTRLSNMQYVDAESMLFTGVTRDGLWLIENGKITRPVRNFRFTESPWFMMNNIDQIGVAAPVWNPVDNITVLAHHPQNAITPVIVPSLKIRDFSFTSTIDAV